MGIEAGESLRALRGLLDVSSRSLDEDLPGALQAVVDQLAEVLDVQAVAINLLRPAWDDFEIVAIHAPPEIIRALRGGTVPRHTVETLLDPAFDVGGASFIPAGAIPDEQLGGVSAIIPRDDRPDDPNRWEEDDELIVPIRGTTGELIGFIGIDEPASGMRPGPEEIAVAVAVADAAAAAVRTAQRALEARRNREAIEKLFEVSSRLMLSDDIDQILVDCCDGIHQALGFEHVRIEVADPGTEVLRLRAAVGWDNQGQPATSTLAELELLCVPELEIEGCYLLTTEQALMRLGRRTRRYQSQRNGSGPRAWNDHWLVVPLRNPAGRYIGRVWPDDPADCLVPSADQLRILRTFANQAAAAISAADNVERLSELARLDDLTGALNRRAFFERLEQELARAARTDEAVTLVVCDLDHFKAVNDQYGHPAGDAALQGFTRIVERNVRSSSDVIGRIGGDEFALVLVGADADDTKRVLERISSTLEEDPPELGRIRASFGAARAPDDGTTRRQLVAVADGRLYEDKRGRRSAGAGA